MVEDAYRRSSNGDIRSIDGESGDSEFRLELRDALDNLLAWAYMLLERNMKKLYEGSWGWDEEKKREELVSRRARFIIAHHIKGEIKTPIAFVHYRYVQEAREPVEVCFLGLDDEKQVVYVYEIQIDPAFQGRGIGRALMTTVSYVPCPLFFILDEQVEEICKEQGLDGICLTVFTDNEAALRFYQRRESLCERSRSSHACLQLDFNKHAMLPKIRHGRSCARP
eukprot:764539-Hanusia_phi.AAC.9